MLSVIHATLINPYPDPGAERIARLKAATRAGSVRINPNGRQVRQTERLPA